MNWQKYCKPENWHKDANLVPLMDSGALETLGEDIAQHGIQHPIVLFAGKVLDGRNRLNACANSKITLTPKNFIQFKPNGLSPRDFVFTQNLHRRQLTIDQRAALAAALVPAFRKEAQKRVGGRPKASEQPSAKMRGVSGKSTALAAQLVGRVSVRYVEQVLSLEKKKPGTLGRIKDGQISIREARREVDALYTHNKPLSARFVAPMLSVLDAKTGDWQQKKQWWRALGVKDGHNEQMNSSHPDLKDFSSTSVFDPVLAECVYTWFAPVSGGSVLDPFAGEATKGIVAGVLGFRYTGCERRAKQLEKNREQANAVAKKYKEVEGKTVRLPNWIEADSAELDKRLPAGEKYDLIFTSPPYYNREIYSNSEEDGSAFKTYEQFIQWYHDVFKQAVSRLKPNRFLVVKVANIPDEKGFYRNFVGDNISCFARLGLRFYGDGILATPIGSAAQRAATRFPKFRQLEATHQNLLCFWNGNDRKLIPKVLGVLKGKEGINAR